MLAHSGSPGRVAVIRFARNADVAIAPRLLGDPINRVIAITDLIHTTEDAFRLETTAYILCDVRVAVLCPEATESRHHPVGALLVVGHACQDDGKGAGRIGEVDVGEQAHPIAHGRGNIEFYADAVIVDRHLFSTARRCQGLLRDHRFDWRIQESTMG